MVNIKIENMSKEFIKKTSVTKALQNLNLEIKSGEFFGILGSSGSGKTTLMRIIAGLEIPTRGSISFDDNVVSKDNKIRVEIEDRNIGMVFQNWALYPHLTNFENIAFPLRVKRLSNAAINKRVKRISELLDITEVLNKRPKEASGGQQQRVAYARALVKEPSILLLDEPFSNLDATIKDVSRKYTKELQKELGFTAIIVSHDPADIFSLSNRVAVIHKGVIMQVGKPIDVFTNPSSIEVARATGEYNIINVELRKNNNGYVANSGKDFSIELGDCPPGISVPDQAIFGFRPSYVAIGNDDDITGYVNCGTAEVAISSYSAGSFRINLSTSQSNEPFVCISSSFRQPGEKVNVFIKKDTAHIFDENTNKLIF